VKSCTTASGQICFYGKLMDLLFGWRPVETAAVDEEVELLVADARGDPT
jgi:hypothetical protein